MSRAQRQARFNQLFRLLAQLQGIELGQHVSQLDHSLQVATRAWCEGAPLDLVLGALMHDVGRVLRPEAHGEASADLIQPFVSDETYWIVRTHDAFMLAHEPATPGLPVDARERYRAERWFDTARLFCDHWDRHGFLRASACLPLAFFRPLMLEACLSGWASQPVGSACMPDRWRPRC